MSADSQQQPDELTLLRAEVREIKGFMADFIASLDDQVSTKKALELSGIASRTTLIAERQRPGTLLTYSNNGRSVSYGRAGCIAHRRAHQHKARA